MSSAAINLNMKNDEIESFVEQPIHCGYLLLFCGSQYCSENLHFAMEVDRYRDIFSFDSASFGKRSWREIDELVQIKSVPTSDTNIDIAAFYKSNCNADWPSTIIIRDAVEGYVKYIWDKFLSDNSATQICMSGIVLQNTVKRLRLLHIYGKEVFSETLIDPMKTMRKDVLPRFLNSDIYQELLKQVKSCNYLPTAAALVVPPPHSDATVESLTQKELNAGLIHLDVIHVMNDRLLYNEFLSYLQSIVSSENLLCMRLIVIFKNSFNEQPPPSQSAASESAWMIYKFFVAPGSAFEVSVSHRRRKQTEQYLASPQANSFVKVEKSVLSALRVHFETYTKSTRFIKLICKIQNLVDDYSREKTSTGCFTFK